MNKEIKVKASLIQNDCSPSHPIALSIPMDSIVKEIKNIRKTYENPAVIKLEIPRGNTLFGIPIELEMEKE